MSILMFGKVRPELDQAVVPSPSSSLSSQEIEQSLSQGDSSDAESISNDGLDIHGEDDSDDDGDDNDASTLPLPNTSRLCEDEAKA